MQADDLARQTGDKDYFCRDQGFAAYLATKFMFLGAVDTGETMPNGGGTIKEFQFLIPNDHDIDQDAQQYVDGSDETKVPAVVMFNKLRLMRQACRKPTEVGAH